jgi:hypothetical protein
VRVDVKYASTIISSVILGLPVQHMPDTAVFPCEDHDTRVIDSIEDRLLRK